MIYITNGQDNTITTDSWLDYIPSNFTVYLDDILIGNFLNESVNDEYIILSIPSTSLVDLQNREYTINYYTESVLMKSELISVRSNIQPEVKSINKSNEVIMYE